MKKLFSLAFIAFALAGELMIVQDTGGARREDAESLIADSPGRQALSGGRP